MKFGVSIPTCREGLVYRPPFATSDDIEKIAKISENLGYDSVWGNDHITQQTYISEISEKPHFYEPLLVLSYIASQVKKIKLATGVLALPLRNIIILAKQVATLDVFSKGRLILGVGLGAYPEEAQAIGISPQERKRRLEEGILALRTLFEQKSASFKGQYITFTDITLDPKPLQTPFPIYMGGNSSGSMKRAVELGQGWVPAALTSNELQQSYEKLKTYAHNAGKNVSSIEIVPEVSITIDRSSIKAISKYRKSPWAEHFESLKKTTFRSQSDAISHEDRGFHGSPNEIIKKIESFQEIPIDHFMLTFTAENVKDLIESLELFSEQVMPSFK